MRYIISFKLAKKPELLKNYTESVILVEIMAKCVTEIDDISDFRLFFSSWLHTWTW